MSTRPDDDRPEELADPSEAEGTSSAEADRRAGGADPDSSEDERDLPLGTSTDDLT